MQWRSPPKTDDEFVETVRKTVTRFDRWSAWSIPMVAIIALSPIVMASLLVTGLMRMLDLMAKGGGNPNAELAWMGFGVGALLGLALGQSAHSAVTQIALIVSGYRTERLLLRYYDARQDSLEDEPSSPDDDVRDV
jgi:hypothetical protein